MPADPIYVWPVVLGDPAPWASLLSADEHATAKQFRRSGDGAEYVACRGMLRKLLGAFLSRDPASLRFAYGAHEKPALADRACAFNVSRSNGLALIAISANGSLGIDLERIRDGVDIDALAETFFSPRDRVALADLPSRERTDCFFRLWVRHEACAKATGRGLVVPAEDHPAGITLHELALGLNYAAAVAWDVPEDREIVLHPLSAGATP